MRNILLVTAATIITTTGCELFKTPPTSQETTKAVTAPKGRNDVSERFIPEFRQEQNIVKVLSPSKKILFSYDPTRLFDIDKKLRTQNTDNEAIQQDVQIINTAIKGVFDAGYYEANKEVLENPQVAAEINTVQIAKPLSVRNLHEGGGDLYIVPVIKDDKIIAAAEVQENTRTGKLEYTACMHPNRDASIEDMPSIGSMSKNALTTESAYEISSLKVPGFRVQAGQDQLERVYVDSNITGPVLWGVFWKQKKQPTPYLIHSSGKVYTFNSGYEVQSQTGKLPAGKSVELRPVN